MKAYIIIPRIIIFLVLNLTLYLITAPINIPSLLGIGEVRVVLVAMLSRLAEEVLYFYLAKALMAEPIAEKSIKQKITT
jgi:hypothetical protein